MKLETTAKLDARNAEIVRLFDAGCTVDRIAADKSLTVRRIQQVLRLHGRRSSRQRGKPKTRSVACQCGAIKRARNQYCRACYIASRSRPGMNAKLTREQVLTVDKRLRDGEGARGIASDVGLCISAVYHIGRGRSWSWLTGRTKRERRRAS